MLIKVQPKSCTEPWIIEPKYLAHHNAAGIPLVRRKRTRCAKAEVGMKERKYYSDLSCLLAFLVGLFACDGSFDANFGVNDGEERNSVNACGIKFLTLVAIIVIIIIIVTVIIILIIITGIISSSPSHFTIYQLKSNKKKLSHNFVCVKKVSRVTKLWLPELNTLQYFHIYLLTYFS